MLSGYLVDEGACVPAARRRRGGGRGKREKVLPLSLPREDVKGDELALVPRIPVQKRFTTHTFSHHFVGPFPKKIFLERTSLMKRVAGIRRAPSSFVMVDMGMGLGNRHVCKLSPSFPRAATFFKINLYVSA